jgi:hypothetical protein
VDVQPAVERIASGDGDVEIDDADVVRFEIDRLPGRAAMHAPQPADVGECVGVKFPTVRIPHAGVFDREIEIFQGNGRIVRPVLAAPGLIAVVQDAYVLQHLELFVLALCLHIFISHDVCEVVGEIMHERIVDLIGPEPRHAHAGVVGELLPQPVIAAGVGQSHENQEVCNLALLDISVCAPASAAIR